MSAIRNRFFQFAFGAAALVAATSSYAFVTAIDEFKIIKGGNTFWLDSFADGVAPPNNPAQGFVCGTTCYSLTFGSQGVENPSGTGKYIMDSTHGGYTLASDNTARLRTVVTLNSNNDPLNPAAGLKPGNTFSVTGLFDLVQTPNIRDFYGISLKDVTTSSGVQSGEALSVGVGRNGGGNLVIHVTDQNYTLDTLTTMASINGIDYSNDQIMLQLSVANNLVTASYQYWNHGAAVGSGFTNIGGPLNNIFQYQQWTRAEFYVSQETTVAAVPEPETYAMMLAGLGLLGFAARRRKQN